MKVAVVRNRKNLGVLHRFGRPSPETYGRKSVQRVMDALRAGGHEVGVFEADATLIDSLRGFIGTDEFGRPDGLVFNMSYGIQGDCRYAHLPAMLEMAGVPYTGSSPFGHTLALDKVVTKILLRDAGVPTPDWTVMERPRRDPGDLRYPLIVKPRHESTSFGLRIVNDGIELFEAVEAIRDLYEQDALVEAYVDGREVNVGLLGNAPLEVLPPVEIDFGTRTLRIDTIDDKFHRTEQEPQKICPAPLPPETTDLLHQIAVRTFRATHCRDYARIDLRLDQTGQPTVLEINSMASLGAGGSFVLAARTAGLDFEALVNRIVDVTHLRYWNRPAPRTAIEPQPALERIAS